jgi:hypothetical protein
MSTELQEQTMEMGTKPVKEHEWLQKLVGEWRTECEMSMGPGQPTMRSTGMESVRNMGGLWCIAEGKSEMPDGSPMEYVAALGYDVSFKEYRGCWFASMSSHLWKQTGQLSSNGHTMTLNCVGPNMYKDGETANYKDVIEIIDANNRVMTSYGEDENGQMQQHMKVTYTRV